MSTVGIRENHSIRMAGIGEILMVTSVHLANVPARAFLSALRHAPDPKQVAGLRSANVAAATPLRTSMIPKLALGRVGLVAFWDDVNALDAFERDDATAAIFSGGLRLHLEPLRAFGSWPGLDANVSRSRRVDYTGPAVVLTLGRLRFSQLFRFLRASGKAEAATANAPGLLWATAMARPPFVATCSLWEDSNAIAAYAFDDRDAGHPSAIRQGQAKPFHHQEAFIRFRPVSVSGSLDGTNPLAEGTLPVAG
jgi:hypothetical protein